MSSTIAIESRKSFAPLDTRSPSSVSTPTAKAMSVAAGIAQPFASGAAPLVTATKISAGSATPPSAASAGRAAVRRSFSSPVTSSRLISRPTTKKKIAIRPSLTQCWRSSVIDASPMPIVSSVCQRSK